MSYHLIAVMLGTAVFVILPMLALTWYSLHEDAHSPAQLRDDPAEIDE